MCSDHRPVCAAFQIKAKTIIPENRSKVYQELLKQLDIMENECMPDATISNNHIRVESVYYMIPSTHQMTIENTGQVGVSLRNFSKVRSWLAGISFLNLTRKDYANHGLTSIRYQESCCQEKEPSSS